jgi:hypothetical protein
MPEQMKIRRDGYKNMLLVSVEKANVSRKDRLLDFSG